MPTVPAADVAQPARVLLLTRAFSDATGGDPYGWIDSQVRAALFRLTPVGGMPFRRSLGDADEYVVHGQRLLVARHSLRFGRLSVKASLTLEEYPHVNA